MPNISFQYTNKLRHNVEHMFQIVFQYPSKLRHSVEYLFLIFYGVVNLGNYQTDMTISSTALNKSKLSNYFQ